MKKLFNVRDFMFNAADVQKLGQYVADQIGLYDGLTLMNQDEIKDLTEEEPDDKRYSEALKNMDKYDMAVYCVDGSIKTGSEEDLAPIIVDGIEGRLRARDVWNLIDRLGLHPEDTGGTRAFNRRCHRGRQRHCQRDGRFDGLQEGRLYPRRHLTGQRKPRSILSTRDLRQIGRRTGPC